MKARLSLLIILVGLFYLLVACSHQQATVPLELLWETSAKNNEILVVFLPGVRDDKEDFLNKGMFTQLRKTGLRIDMVAADLHLACLQGGTTTERLYEDIIAPAQKQGYKKIWLVGLSWWPELPALSEKEIAER